MNMWPSQDVYHMNQFYGQPGTNAWESANLVEFIPPFQMSYDEGGGVVKPVVWQTPDKKDHSIFKCHEKVVGSLGRVFDALWLFYGKDFSAIKRVGLNKFDGCYNYRDIRGSTQISTHSYGAAVDINAENNPLGKAWLPSMMSLDIVNMFKSEGWVWGGDFSRPDCMHFQAARID